MTTIINLHFGIYDTVILVVPILLTADVLYRNSQIYTQLTHWFKDLIMSIYILPWISQHVARVTGFQLFSVALAIMGSYQILLAHTYSKLTQLHMEQNSYKERSIL